jgi:hypothetical protein
MSRLTTGLSLFLAFQLAITAAVFWPREDRGEADARTPLLSANLDGVDRLIIRDGEASVVLALGESGWLLPDYHQLPVDAGRVQRSLVELPGLRRGWPVASSSGAAARFEVAEDSFQRSVEFFQGDATVGRLFIGTSPGFRKVHARVAGSDAVYAVDFNSFDLPANPEDWLDKQLLGVENVTAVRGLDYQLRREGDSWQGERGDSVVTPDAELVDGLINGLTSLRVNGAADVATAEILAEMAVPPTLQVDAEGVRHEYRLYEIEEAYYIQRSDIPVYFSLSAFDYDRLNDVSGESLYKEAGEDTTDQGGEASGDEESGDVD